MTHNCFLLIVCVTIEDVFEISTVGAQRLPKVKETTPHLQGMLSRQCLTLLGIRMKE